MTTRRSFLKHSAAAAAGVMFCGCGMVHKAGAQQSRQTLPVSVNGKRIKTIDVHAHCHIREAAVLLGADGEKLQVLPINGGDEIYIGIEKRLAAMDAQAVDLEVLSINPYWYDRDRDLARPDRQDPEREACGALRFEAGPVCSLRIAHTSGSRSRGSRTGNSDQEAEASRGAAIGGAVNGVNFSDPKFNPVWAKAEELGVPVFIHPQGIPELSNRAFRKRLARQHDCKSARNHDRLVSSDLRGDARSFSRTDGHCRAWRRVSAVDMPTARITPVWSVRKDVTPTSS